MMVMEAKVTRIKITGRRKEKLGLEKGKKEEEEMRLGKKSGTFLLYTLKGNNNYKIPIITLRKIQDITASITSRPWCNESAQCQFNSLLLLKLNTSF